MNAELRLYSLYRDCRRRLLLGATPGRAAGAKPLTSWSASAACASVKMGRITDGTVIDVNEMQTNGSGELQLLIYHYDVAGVSYEASQDVSSLRHMVDLHSCRAGLMTSIKYDPGNPGNSIVISENWTGLRH